MKKYLLGLLIVCLTGCATLPDDAPSYTRAPAPSADKAILYIYRLGAYPPKRTPKVFVDDKLIMRPPEKAYTWIDLPAGEHKIKTDWGWRAGAPDRELTIKMYAGDSYYLKITGGFDKEADRPFSSAIIQLTQMVAESELRSYCRYITPGN